MKRKGAALALTVAMTMAVSGSVYAEPKSVGTEKSGSENSSEQTGSETKGKDDPGEPEARSSAADGCETGHHLWTEWTVTIPADCVTEGQQTRNCKECGISETASIPKTKEHDLKEISRQEATDDKDGFSLYACKRNGCDYQMKEVIPAKAVSDPEDADGNKDGGEKEDTLGSDTKDDKSGENSEDEAKDDSTGDSDTKEDPDKNISDSRETSDKTDTEKDAAEELPDEDIDEEYASFAYATSSEVVAEYDPETAVSTRKITNPIDPSDTEEVEGKAVPEGIVEVKRDFDGNITDLAISTSVEEIKHGFSFSSESKTLHSIAINSKVPGVNWITLTAKEPASELGIRLKQTDDGMIMTLTENQKPVNITRITEAKKKITMTTSTGGSCEISQEIQKFTVRDKNKNFADIDMNEVVFHEMNGQNPYIELVAFKALKAGKTSEDEEKLSQDTAKKDEKYYWIQQYDDESQTPVVITVYEK